MNERRERRGFEPPPWEREEFERFQKERAEREKEAQLEAVLAAARLAQEPAVVAAVGPKQPVGEAVRAPESGEQVGQAASTQAEGAEFPTPGIPESEIERMLIDLRLEEPRAVTQYKVFGNVVVGLLLASGLGFVIWSAFLFARTQANDGTTIALATPFASATASALMTLWGLMLIGGAVLLWRKYNVR